MTILNFGLWSGAVCILTDTLVSDVEQGVAPWSVITKVFPVPHMQGVITAIGSIPFIQEWATAVNGALVAKDMGELDRISAVGLREMFARHRGSKGRPPETTIYHFGFDSREGGFVGFSYSSSKGFASQRVAEGVETYPTHGMDIGEEIEFPEVFVEVAKAQKQRIADAGAGVAGGQLIATTMSLEEGIQGNDVVIEMRRCYEFHDYEAVMAKLATPGPGDRRPV